MNSQPATTYQPQHIRERGEQAVQACQDPELLVWPADPETEQMRWFLRQAPDERQVANILLIGMNPSTATALSMDGSGGDPTTQAMFAQFGMVLDYMNSLDRFRDRRLSLNQCRLTIVNLTPFVDSDPSNMDWISCTDGSDPHQLALPFTEQIIQRLIPRSDLVVAMWGGEKKWKKLLTTSLRPTIARAAQEGETPAIAFLNGDDSPGHPLGRHTQWWIEKAPAVDYLPYLLRG